MRGLWLTAFILGAFVARHVPLPGSVPGSFFLIGALAAFGLARLQSKLVAPAVALFACCWGAAHHAPPPPPGTHVATVLAADVADDRPFPVIVRDGDVRMEVFAPALPGTVVRIRAGPADGAFGNALSRVTVVAAAPQEPRSAVGMWIASVRAAVRGRLERLGRPAGAWLCGMLLGDRVAFPRAVRDIFMRTGLYHLLIVSGMHVAAIAFVLSAVMRLPFQLAYAARAIDPGVWLRVRAALCVGSAAIGGGYAAVAGLSSASQRALILFVAHQLGCVFWGLASRRRMLGSAACAQTVLFPCGFLGEATLMSWGAYLLVLVASETRGGSLWRRVSGVLHMQLQLLVLTGACFAQLPLVGIIANPCIVATFPFILAVGLMTATIGPGSAAQLASHIHEGFLAIVAGFARLTELAPWLYVDAATMPAWGRAVLAAAGARCLLNALARLSISEGIQERERVSP